MNAAQVHLLLNHIPVVGVPIGLALALLAWQRKSQELWLGALALLLFCGVMAYPTYLTGKSAEHVVEHLPDITEEFIEPHENAALLAMLATVVLGVAAAIGLWQHRQNGRLSQAMASVVLLLAVVSTGLMAWTAHLGGQLRHTETRPGFVVPAGEAESGEGEEK